MNGENWTVNSDPSLENLIKHLRELYADKKYVQVKWTTGKQITSPQNRSLHQYCEWVADELNGRGLDMVKTLKPGVEIPWSKVSVKEHIWRPVQEVHFGVKSTKKLERLDVSIVYDVINRHLSNKFGVYVPFPSRDNNG
jgi:hypothetical protein